MQEQESVVIWAVVRPTRGHTEFTSFHKTQRGAEDAAAECNIRYPRGARYEACQITVTNE